MQEFNVIGGKQNVRIKLFIEDARYADRRGLTDVAYNTAQSVYYTRRADDSATPITLVQKVGTEHQEGAWTEIDKKHMPGTYELHLPNACIALHFGQCDITIRGLPNMVDTHLRIHDTRDQRTSGCRYVTTKSVNRVTLNRPTSAPGGY